MATTITLTDQTAQRLRLLEGAWDTDSDGAVSRLIDRLSRVSARGARADAPDGEGNGVAVYAVYEGRRVDGIYDAKAKKLTVTSSPCDGQSFKSPSGAAIAVVQALNPSVNPNRNGWSFWTVVETGRTLQSIRYSH